jgi:hypothetical protein
VKKFSRGSIVCAVLLGSAVRCLSAAAPATPVGMTCVGVYSETSDGSVSYRVGTGNWIVIKVGDKIPANAEIMINVDRDWVEFMVTGAPTAVCELTGSTTGEVLRPRQNSDSHGRVNSALTLPRC